jgi:hypothetical protein
MAYVGIQPITQTIATSSQRFNGDGTSVNFTLQQSVSSATDIIVQVGSTLQIPGTNYTASGTNLTFTAGNAPANGTNNVSVTYIAGALNTVNLTANVFPLGTNVAPSISGVGAVTTGLYWPTTSSLAVTASGTQTVLFSATTAATSTTSGALQVKGGLGVTGAHYNGGVIYATSGTASTNSTTGALVVTGGVGVSGSQYVGGSMTISGALTVAGSFNTTSTNSLIVNTPFLFLANTNVGNAVDIGVVGQYNDGTTRYTGIYKTAADGRYRLFSNLVTQPGTTVTTNDGSYVYADLWLGNANVTQTADSVSSQTGALQVMGGIGARGSFYVNSLNNAVAIGNGGTNGIGNIGASGAGFNTIYAKATTAQYADLAEKYLADDAYTPGTVLEFGGEQEVTVCDSDMSSRIAGVVSTQPGYVMNEGLTGTYVSTVALLGRVPCKVRGPIVKGDMLVSAGDGYARAETIPQAGTIIGKALENFTGTEGVIEVVVGKN